MYNVPVHTCTCPYLPYPPLHFPCAHLHLLTPVLSARACACPHLHLPVPALSALVLSLRAPVPAHSCPALGHICTCPHLYLPMPVPACTCSCLLLPCPPMSVPALSLYAAARAPVHLPCPCLYLLTPALSAHRTCPARSPALLAPALPARAFTCRTSNTRTCICPAHTCTCCPARSYQS
jgi:hypothetical protein